MWCYYEDILEKMGEPAWWNEHAVPRYVDFNPRELASIYACECVLMEIACQGCGRVFKVAMSLGPLDRDEWKNPYCFPPHYGDPPNVDCCPAGATMNSDHIRVLGRWVWKEGDWKEAEVKSVPRLME